MHQNKLTLILLLILGAASARAQLITTFGNAAENGGSWTYAPATSMISGTEGFGTLSTARHKMPACWPGVFLFP